MFIITNQYRDGEVTGVTSGVTCNPLNVTSGLHVMLHVPPRKATELHLISGKIRWWYMYPHVTHL